MTQHCSSLYSIYSKRCTCSNLQGVVNSPRVITISVGVYFLKYQERYKKLKDLPYLFTKEIDNIIADNPKAFCIHNDFTSVIYLYSDCEEENYAVCSDICIWLTKLQTTLKTIRFCTGMDRRDIKGANDVILSELMSYFRLFKSIQQVINQEYVIMDRSIGFISEIKKVLDKVIEYSGYDLHSKDVVEISEFLDLLINKRMGYGSLVVGLGGYSNMVKCHFASVKSEF